RQGELHVSRRDVEFDRAWRRAGDVSLRVTRGDIESELSGTINGEACVARGDAAREGLRSAIELDESRRDVNVKRVEGARRDEFARRDIEAGVDLPVVQLLGKRERDIGAVAPAPEEAESAEPARAFIDLQLSAPVREMP